MSTKITRVPPPLDNLVYVQEWVKPRVSNKRFSHTAGVAQTAKDLANKFSSDSELAYLAELAGWLHDACKETKDNVLIEQAKEYGLKLNPVEEANGHLLHGPVAAQLVKKTFALQNTDVLNAIAEHTLGAIDMCLLSKIVFLADAVEPNRPGEYADPIRQAINDHADSAVSCLDRAVLIACNSNLQSLLQINKVIHPRTVEVRNYYLQICQGKN